ncbi:hypothetical protein PQ455_18765 [Sphingomonas naphthae]|uniref:Lipoprotein n=1 Tax=Sphingomonas naphthae TaxID=1813468 RepID=A0ABY7TK65_9SPHN|nr:hypothetical protein [Sphingomonas naphthae]WCT73623.1 hypothetical protein PQ455_18765 [Sphingomonas naphthae]
MTDMRPIQSHRDRRVSLAILAVAAATLTQCSPPDERDVAAARIGPMFPGIVREDIVMEQASEGQAILCGSVRPKPGAGNDSAARRFVIPTGANFISVEPVAGPQTPPAAAQEFQKDWRAYCQAQ